MSPINQKKFDPIKSLLCPLILLSGMIVSCAGPPPEPPPPEMVSVKVIVDTAPEEADAQHKIYTDLILSSLYLDRGDHEKGLIYLSKALEADPDSIYLNKRMADLLRLREDYTGATEYAQKCLSLDPENVGCLVLLARIHSQSGNEESAAKEYEKILKLAPGYQRVRLFLVTYLLKEKRFQDAKSHLNTLIEQNPELVIAYYYLGRIHLELGDFPEAEKAYLRAVALNRDMEPALFDLAGLYQMQKRHEDAMDIYERLLRISPDNQLVKERLVNIYYKLGLKDKIQRQIAEIKERSKPGEPARQTLGLIYLRDGRLDESILELDLIVSSWPKDYRSRYYLASAYEEKGELEKALDHFRLIKEESDYYVNSRVNIAQILEGHERYNEAIDVLQGLLAREKAATEIYLMLASIYETVKDYGKAMEVIEEGRKQDEKNIDLIFRLGVILDKAGQKEKALAQMRRILEIDPNNADTLNYIGYTYAEQGIKLDEALELIKKALRFKPDSGYIIDSLGWVFFQQGAYDKALDSLKRAVSIIPDDPTITEHLGDVYLKKQEYEKSLKMYEKALFLKHLDKEKIKEKIRKVSEFLR